MSDSSESDDGPSRWNRHRRGNGKNNRKIVMRIEFDDSDDSSSGSEPHNENDDEAIIRPSGSGRRGRCGGKRLISSDDDSCSSGSEIVRTVVRRGGNKRKAVIIEEEPAVDEPHTSTAVQSTPSSSSNSQAPPVVEDGFASDSSNDELEKCPICLLSLRNQEIGKPSICDHLFCAICIEEWSRNVRTCPIDRQAFDTILVLRSINNRELVREIQVKETKKDEFETEVEEIFEDPELEEALENCQICNRPDREDVMLLCDGCNHGYHMDCLSNPLTEIPDGFWYCDNCFQSEEEDIQENLNELYEDLREMGIPETRLRVREVRQPRIPRTRQSERIRASIMARTRRSNTRISTEMNFSQPAPSSSARVSTRSSTSASQPRTSRKRRNRRRSRRQRRTYVVEYDVDNFDQKFEIKTTKRVIRKKKSSKRIKRRGRRKPTVRTSGTHQRNAELQDYLSQISAAENGSSLVQPRFSLFGASNELEYFSDESENSNVGGDSEVGRGSEGGASIQTSIRIHSFTSSRSHSRRKALIRDLDQPRQVDILSSIMDLQDRFHNATRQNHINEVKIGPDGTLNLPSKKGGDGEKKKGEKKENNAEPNDVNQAPMYPRGGGNNYTNTGGNGGNSGGGAYNNRYNNQSNYRNSTGGGNSGGGGSGNRNSGASGNGNSGGALFNAFRRDNSFSSDNNIQQNRLNISDNANSNRDRFRQNQQQRQNQNNQNRFSLGGNNDSFNRSLSDTPSNSLRDSNRPQTSLLFSIGPISLFDTPKKTESSGQSSNASSSLGSSLTSLRSGGNFLSKPTKPGDPVIPPLNPPPSFNENLVPPLDPPPSFNAGPNSIPLNSGNFLSTPTKPFHTDLSAPPPSNPMSLSLPNTPLSVPPPSSLMSVPPPMPAMSVPPPMNPITVPPPMNPISAPPPIIPMSAPPPSAPLNYSMGNAAIPMTPGNNFLPIHQPPPPILPVYGPVNMPSIESVPTPAEAAPMPATAPAVTPLAPPPWNSNLFRLTSDYADSNDDEDDSDCPNFSVYSAESFQVARSSESGLETATGAAQSSASKKVNSNSNRQEDEFEENEEDLVQLGDDDEIPDALEKGNSKSGENDPVQSNKKVPESEIYEPEFPTVEAADDDDDDDDTNETDNDENIETVKTTIDATENEQEQNENADNECVGEAENEKEVGEDAESKDMDLAETDDDSGEPLTEGEPKVNENAPTSPKNDDDKGNEKIEAENVSNAESIKEKDVEMDTNTNETTDDNESETTPDQPEQKVSKAPRPRKKGILELYDDSDWEEWNVGKAELIPMPPEPAPEPNVSDENISKSAENSENEDDDVAEKVVTNDVNDRASGDESNQLDVSLTPTKENDSKEMSMTPEKRLRSPDEGGTPEIDEAKLRQLKTKKADGGSEDDEQERSYTPCLDEKTELEEGECADNEDAGAKDKTLEIQGDMSLGVVDGMEMEMISEEDEGMLSEEHQRSGKANDKGRKDDAGGKRSKKEQFKKISKSTKERNYRDKENRNRGRRRGGSRPRSRSRSFSRGKENRNRQRPPLRRNRRREIERYNVRNVIGQPRTYKDRYGRDTSRPARSRSRSRSLRRLRTKSRTRSLSPKHDRRSFSMSPTPMSPRRLSARRVASPQRRISPRRRRVLSPRRSRSRRRSHSIRRSSLPRRRSRSPIRLRSRSRSTSLVRANRRNQRQKRRASSYSCSGSCSRSHSKISRSRSRSLGPRSPRRSRSKSPVRQKKLRRRSKDRKKKRNKKRVVSMSPSPVHSKRGARSPARLPAIGRKKKKRARTKTPVIEEERWSKSPGPAPDTLDNGPNDPSWTPPLIGTNNDHLTVILKNKEAATNARKKREKKKKEKRRETNSKKDKRRQRSEMRESPVAPSKEVFASGNNILVSVSFNKDNNANAPQQTTVVTLPPTREEILSNRRSPERHVRRVKKPRDKTRRRKKLDTKPVAIIDLDRSPFQIIAQSPRDIIILTDESDREPDDHLAHQHNESINSMEMDTNDRNVADLHEDEIEKSIETQRPGVMEEEHEHFEIQQLGPKTPPDPPSVKFSLPKGKQMKVRNPLHEEQEEIQEEVESEHPGDQMQMPTTNKIGPNTPPESGPCSPDAYDPFDPTKSPSLSPAHSPAPPQNNEPEEINEKVTHSQETNNVESRPPPIVQEKTMNPVELVMALINSKAAMSQQDMINLNNDARLNDAEMNAGIDENNASGKNIAVLSNVLISSGKQPTRPIQVLNTSPPKLPISRQNGGTGIVNDDVIFAGDPESPYSPDSGDYDDLFDPPPQDNSISLAQLAKNRKSKKADIFDNLFGSTSPGGKVRMPNFSRRKGKSRRTRVAKTNDDQVKIFDELPSSAVELQVKDKFLRKLNRQERVVEEVKLVLKPHYNRKRISKEDYKEILRRSVPKICHSRSGEINPAKIKNLIEAYVKKFRQRNKLNMIGTGQVSSAVKCAAYLKKL